MAEESTSEQMRETANSMAFAYGGPDVVQGALHEFANKVALSETVTKQLRDDLRESTSISVQLGVELEKHEAAIVVLRTYLDKHKHHPHAPVLSGGSGGGTIRCVCHGCILARKALTALGGGK